MTTFLILCVAWLVLLFVSWPLALGALVLVPVIAIVALVLVPLALAGLVIGLIVAAVGAILFLPLLIFNAF